MRALVFSTLLVAACGGVGKAPTPSEVFEFGADLSRNSLPDGLMSADGENYAPDLGPVVDFGSAGDLAETPAGDLAETPASDFSTPPPCGAEDQSCCAGACSVQGLFCMYQGDFCGGRPSLCIRPYNCGAYGVQCCTAQGQPASIGYCTAAYGCRYGKCSTCIP